MSTVTLIHSNPSQSRQWWRRPRGTASTFHNGVSCVLSLNDDARTVVASCTSPQPPNVRRTLYESRFCTALRNCLNSAREGRVDMGVWCWCLGDVYNVVFLYDWGVFEWEYQFHPRVYPYFICRRDENFRDLTMRTVSYSNYSTILSLNDYYRLGTTSSDFG